MTNAVGFTFQLATAKRDRDAAHLDHVKLGFVLKVLRGSSFFPLVDIVIYIATRLDFGAVYTCPASWRGQLFFALLGCSIMLYCLPCILLATDVFRLLSASSFSPISFVCDIVFSFLLQFALPLFPFCFMSCLNFFCCLQLTLVNFHFYVSVL